MHVNARANRPSLRVPDRPTRAHRWTVHNRATGELVAAGTSPTVDAAQRACNVATYAEAERLGHQDPTRVPLGTSVFPA